MTDRLTPAMRAEIFDMIANAANEASDTDPDPLAALGKSAEHLRDEAARREAKQRVENQDEIDSLLEDETACRAAKDGECHWNACPQMRDNEPANSGRHCPLDTPEAARREAEGHVALRPPAALVDVPPSPMPDAPPPPAPINPQDGNRPLPIDRETLGRMVREAWVRWAQTQPKPKPSWLVPYDELSETDKEADRQIGEAVARWTLIHDAARLSLSNAPPPPAPFVTDHKWLDPECHASGCQTLILKAEIEKLKDERDKYMWQARDTCRRAEAAEAEIYVPGIFECPKCKLTAAHTILSAKDGTMSAASSMDCANGCGPAWRVTWKHRAQEAAALFDKCFDEKKAAKADAKRLREALEAYRHAARGFAQAVREDTRLAYPWPALDLAEDTARAALAQGGNDG